MPAPRYGITPRKGGAAWQKEQILAALEAEDLTQAQLVERTGIAPRSVGYRLKELREEGAILGYMSDGEPIYLRAR